MSFYSRPAEVHTRFTLHYITLYNVTFHHALKNNFLSSKLLFTSFNPLRACQSLYQPSTNSVSTKPICVVNHTINNRLLLFYLLFSQLSIYVMPQSKKVKLRCYCSRTFNGNQKSDYVVVSKGLSQHLNSSHQC